MQYQGAGETINIQLLFQEPTQWELIFAKN